MSDSLPIFEAAVESDALRAAHAVGGWFHRHPVSQGGDWRPAMPEIILVRAVQTCTACPSQWDAWDADGRYWYLRFCSSRGTMARDYLSDTLSFDADGDGLYGEISLGEFIRRIGVTWAPDLAASITAWEEPPDDR